MVTEKKEVETSTLKYMCAGAAAIKVKRERVIVHKKRWNGTQKFYKLLNVIIRSQFLIFRCVLVILYGALDNGYCRLTEKGNCRFLYYRLLDLAVGLILVVSESSVRV